jgi:hypothetical protein
VLGGGSSIWAISGRPVSSATCSAMSRLIAGAPACACSCGCGFAAGRHC